MPVSPQYLYDQPNVNKKLNKYFTMPRLSITYYYIITKITRRKVHIVKTALTDPSSEAGKRGGRMKMCCSSAMQIWAALVL